MRRSIESRIITGNTRIIPIKLITISRSRLRKSLYIFLELFVKILKYNVSYSSWVSYTPIFGVVSFESMAFIVSLEYFFSITSNNLIDVLCNKKAKGIDMANVRM